MAAHPQQDEQDDVAGGPVDEGLTVSNPFPTEMTVPGPGGEDATIELKVVDGVLYAPMLEFVDLAPHVKQYVTQYCAAWSMSVLTVGKLGSWPSTPPRRGQIIFREAALHAMLGLGADERLVRLDVDQVKGELRLVVESPRLPPMPFWDGGPPIISLPVAAHYEPVIG